MEIYLNKMNQLEDQMESSAADSDVQNLKAEQNVLEDEFRGFLETNKVNDQGRGTNKLISGYGRN